MSAPGKALDEGYGLSINMARFLRANGVTGVVVTRRMDDGIAFDAPMLRPFAPPPIPTNDNAHVLCLR